MCLCIILDNTFRLIIGNKKQLYHYKLEPTLESQFIAPLVMDSTPSTIPMELIVLIQNKPNVSNTSFIPLVYNSYGFIPILPNELHVLDSYTKMYKTDTWFNISLEIFDSTDVLDFDIGTIIDAKIKNSVLRYFV